MTTMGPAVMLGVAFTNLPGIICLHWAQGIVFYFWLLELTLQMLKHDQAQIIEIFFFRMNFVTTLVGIAHGLIFLPVFLAYFGPNINKARLFEQQEQELKERAATVVDRPVVKDGYVVKDEKPIDEKPNDNSVYNVDPSDEKQIETDFWLM